MGRIDDPDARRSPLIASYDPDTSDPAERSADERGSGVDVRASWPDDAIAELVAEGGLGTGQVIASLEAGNMKTVDEVKDEYWKFPSSFVRGTLNTTPLKMLVVECTGDSMEPTLHSGDRVWVNTGHVRPTPDGLYAIRDAFGAVIVKRLRSRRSGRSGCASSATTRSTTRARSTSTTSRSWARSWLG